MEQSNNYQLRNKINPKLDFLGQVPDTYYNEVMAEELKNLSRENAELKFCLEKLNKKFEKEMKDLKLQNSNKIKEINSSKEIIKKNVALIELLGEKISKHEKIFKNIESKTKQKNVLDKNIKEKLIKVENENALLLSEIKKEIKLLIISRMKLALKKKFLAKLKK